MNSLKTLLKKEKKLFEEVKNEVAKEAEEKKKEGDEKEEEEGDEKEDEEKDSIKSSEKFISKSEHTKQMNELKSQMGVVEKKLRFKEVTAVVRGFVFSESNPKGVLLPKNKEAAVKILMAVNEKVAKMFKEFLGELPAVSSKLFEESGSGDEGDSAPVSKEAQKLVKDGKARTYGEAIKIIGRKDPNLLKDK